MTLAVTPESDRREFAIEDISTGVFASGFGHLGDGRSFSFHVHRGQLLIEVYHPRLAARYPTKKMWWRPQSAAWLTSISTTSAV